MKNAKQVYRTHRSASARSRQNGKRLALRQLFTELLEPRLLLTSVVSTNPLANSHNAMVSTDVSATLDQDVDAGTVTPQTFAVHSMQRGQLVGDATTVSVSGPTISHETASNFFPGELAQASASPAIESAIGSAAQPYVWQFRAGVEFGSALFKDGGLNSEKDDSQDVALGDLDGDGDLDAFVVNKLQSNRVWINSGGEFTDSGQSLGNSDSRGVALGDIDGDGDLDAFVANGHQRDRLWLNDAGVFRDSGQHLGDHRSYDVAFGDLDGDGDLDAFVGKWLIGHRVFTNNEGVFSDSGQTIGSENIFSVSLGVLPTLAHHRLACCV